MTEEKKAAPKKAAPKPKADPNAAALRRLAALQREDISAADRAAVTQVIRLLS